MYTTIDTLPPYGVIRVYVTGERHTAESLEFGDAAERGWANRLHSSDLYESRNDVAPVFEARVREGGHIIETCDIGGMWEDDTEATDSALDTLRDLITNLYPDSGSEGGTLYGADAVTLDYSTGDTFTYAIHAHIKHYDSARGWVEDDLDIIELSGWRRP